MIVGALPQSQPPASEEERFVPGVSGRWFTPEEARAATQVGRLCVGSALQASACGGVAVGCCGMPSLPAQRVGNEKPLFKCNMHMHAAPLPSLLPPQEREALKKEGYHQAVAQGVMGKAAEGQGNWVTLSRPGAKRVHDGASPQVWGGHG